MAVSKKRVIKSLDNLTDDLKELVKKQYPNGFEHNISRILNAKNEPIFVFPLETDDSTYLIKVPAVKNSEGGYEVESTPDPEEEFNNSGEGDYDSDEFSGNGEEEESGRGYEDEDGGGKRGREASYDPDFDG